MLKRIGIGVGIFVGLLVLVAVLFILFFPKQAAIEEADRRIEAATGRTLAINGRVDLTFWPALGFSAEQASLSNPEGFDTHTPFLAADRIVFAVAVLPLLRGDIQVKRLILEGAAFNLTSRGERGAETNNWTFPTDESEQENTLQDLRLDEVRLTDSTISFQGAADAEPMQLSDMDASLALESLDLPAALEAAFDYRGQRLNVSSNITTPRAVLEKGQTPLTAEITSAPLNTTFNGTFNAADGALAGQLEAHGESLRGLMAWIGSPMAEGGGFGAYRLAASVAHAGEETQLNEAVIGVDDIEARGRLSLINQDNGRLRVNGALNAPSVDLNTYLPPPAQAGAESGEAGVQVDTAWSNDPLDLSGLRALDADLALEFGALKFQQMSFANVAMALRIANGAADARLSRIALYGGTGTARLIADGAGATPRIAVELTTENIQAEPLLRDAIGFDKIAGRGRLTASLVGAGASQAAIMRSLRGTAAFNFNDGQWKGVNLAAVARTIQAVMTGTQAAGGGATDFAELSSTFQISNGVAATDNMRLLNPFVRLEGQGLIDIGQQSIDMRIAPRAVRSAQGQGGDAAIAGLGIPFRVRGPWSRVSFAPDLGNVVQNELQRRMGDILGQQNGENPLTQLGTSLFGQRPAAQTTTETPAPPANGATTQAPVQTPAPAPEAQKQRTPEEQARDALGGLFQRN